MNLRQLRMCKDLSLSQAAKKIGLTKTYLSYLENNKRVPTIFTMESIARGYDVDIREIFEILCNTYNINLKATKEI